MANRPRECGAAGGSELIALFLGESVGEGISGKYTLSLALREQKPKEIGRALSLIPSPPPKGEPGEKPKI